MRDELYHPGLYDGTRPAPSWWEASAPPPQDGFRALERDERCDVAIVGAGYTGLSAALHLARDHGIGARVLEAGHIGWGASGRNGGFCCLAATKLSIEAMVKRFGLAETKAFYAAQLEGIELVDALERDEAIDFERQGDGIYEVAHRPSRLKGLAAHGRLLESHFGIRSRLLRREAFRAEGHESTEQFGALHVQAGFGLHPLKLLSGLARAAARRGAVLHPHSRVVHWSRADGRHRLATAGGSVTAARVILATNGYTPERLHPGFTARSLPALSNILTTRPLSADELAAQQWSTECPITNTRDLLFYYRLLPDRRLLFGARGDLSGSPEAGRRMRAWLTRRFGQVFPHWANIEVSHFWRGLISANLRFAPALGRLPDDPSVLFGFGYHGNGVNTAPWAGRALAGLAAGREVAIPVPMAGLPPRIPFAALRVWGLRGLYLWFRLTDDVF